MKRSDKIKQEERFVEWCAWIGAILFVAFCVVWVLTMCSCENRLKKENERLREELAKAQQYVPLTRDTIRDTVEVVTQQIVETTHVKEVLTEADRRLLKEVGLKVKEVESYQKTGMVTTDTVYLTLKDSATDTPLYYKDAWAEFEYQDSRLRYSVRDSLAIAIKKQYKRRFLWWKWGTKGYELKVVNFNPHSSIRYSSFVKRKQ